MHSRPRAFQAKYVIRQLLVPALGILMAGCAQTQNDNYAVIRSGDRATRGENGAFEYHYPATAPVLNADELKRFVEQHRNQVVVLEFWASWSAGSRDQISRLARLHDEHRGDGLRVIACTFDEPREWRTHTVPVLNSAGANYPCVVVPRGARQSIGDWLDPSWRFDLPARFIVDRQGTVVARAHGDEAILAALDSWGTSRTRRRTRNERSVEPGTREIRVARAPRRETSSTSRDDIAVAERSEPTPPSRETTSATATDDSTTTRSRVRTESAPRYASSRQSRTATADTSTRRYSRQTRSTSATERPRPASTVRRSSVVRRASSSTSVGAASTRVKLINVKTGQSDWMPVVSRDEGLDAAAAAVASAVRSRIGRSSNPRIAVMPLSSMRNWNYATPLGREAADAIVSHLKEEGYFDLVSPLRTRKALEDAGVTVTQIDFDSSVIQGKVDADYLLIGWVRNDVDELIRSRRTPTAVAGDAGSSDDGYISPRRESEDFSEY